MVPGTVSLAFTLPPVDANTFFISIFSLPEVLEKKDLLCICIALGCWLVEVVFTTT